MKKIYFDSNIYSEIVRKNIRPEQIKHILSKNKFRLVISAQNMFEIASCWKSGKVTDIEQGIKRFTLIENLLPCRFFETIPNILLMEIDKAINDASVSPFVGDQDKKEYELEISKFAQGTYDNRAKNFIENRWADKRNNIQKQIAVLIQNKNIFNAADTLDDFFKRNMAVQQMIVEGLIAKRVRNIPNRHRKNKAEKILRKSKRFPMIITVVKANLFLDFRVLKFKSCSHDTLDDLRHLITASYSDVFVTDDRKLYDYSSEIQPKLEVLLKDDFILQ